jgi:hypothetical protein
MRVPWKKAMAAASASKLKQLWISQKDADSWKPGETGDIAWESNQPARARIYQARGEPAALGSAYEQRCHDCRLATR